MGQMGHYINLFGPSDMESFLLVSYTFHASPSVGHHILKTLTVLKFGMGTLSSTDYSTLAELGYGSGCSYFRGGEQ